MIFRMLIAQAVAVGVMMLVLAAALWSQPVRAAECRGQWLVASHYGAESGRRTASGKAFNGTQMVAAHRSWAFGTPLRVSYHGRSVKVIVEDRGPFIRGRQLDLSTAAANVIGMTKAGVAKVCVERL